MLAVSVPFSTRRMASLNLDGSPICPAGRGQCPYSLLLVLLADALPSPPRLSLFAMLSGL